MGDISVNDVSNKRLAVPAVPAAASQTRAITKTPDNVTAAQTQATSKKKPGQAQPAPIVKNVEQLQHAKLKLLINKNPRQVVTQVLDQNDQVMQQIPPQDVLDLQATANEINGKIFDQKV